MSRIGQLEPTLPKGITTLPTENSTKRPEGLHDTKDVSFEGVLTRAVTDASAMERVAASKVQALAAGVSDDMHGTMIAAKEAEISLKLVGSIRNKLLDAFHEIWRTSV